MDQSTRRPRAAMALMLIAGLATGCAGSDIARTRQPLVTPSPPVQATAQQPGPTPIVAAGSPAPALDDLVANGAPFDLASLRGHPTFLFFGYTHCPDVCPATTGELMQVVDRRPDARVVFVTIDPERDTPEFMADWTKYMPDGFIGVTGSPTAIRTAADGWGARYARVDSASAAGYSMSHTAFVYLIDPEGRLVLSFPFGTSWETMLETLDAYATPATEDPS